VNPLGDADLQTLIDSLKGDAPNSDTKKKAGKNTSENQYLRDQTRLLKDLATADNEYQNVLSGRNQKTGQAEAQMASLIQTDERYIKMSQAQKDNLMSWARQVDEANQKVRDAIKVQDAWNDALQAGYTAQRQIAQLGASGYVSKYGAASAAEDSFKQGGENQFMSKENQSSYLQSQMKKDNDQRLLDMAQYQASIKLSNEDLMFQADLIGKGAQEVQRLTEFHKIDLMVQQLSVGASDEMVKKYREMGQALKTEVGGALDYVLERQSSMMTGLSQALADFSDQAANLSQNTYDAASRAFDGIANIVGQFVVTGKADFKSFAASVIADFAKMEARILLSQVFNWLMGFLGGSGGMASGYGSATSNFSWASSSGFGNNYASFGGFAKGAVFSANPSLSAYSNGVYTTPQFFQQYAKGGVFAEAGAEAIMPLAKGSNGELGVKVHGGTGEGGDVYITIETNVTESGASSKTSETGGRTDRATAYKELSKQMAAMAEETIQRSMQPGGSLWKAGVNRS
jgi:Phage-related minor tail protein